MKDPYVRTLIIKKSLLNLVTVNKYAELSIILIFVDCQKCQNNELFKALYKEKWKGELLGRRLADPTVLETLGVNFRRAAGPPGPATPMSKDKFL